MLRGLSPGNEVVVGSAVLTDSLVEHRAVLRGDGAPPPAPLLDLEQRVVEMPGEPILVVKPADWPALREAEADEGRPAPYWATLWASGIALAQRLAAEDLRGLRVLELGCGLGVAAVAAARAGATVLATDGEPDAVAFAAHTLMLNGAEADVAVASWTDLADDFEDDPFDLVVGADVLYRRDNAKDLAVLLPRLVARDGAALIADPGRAGASELWPMLRRRWRRTISSAPGHSGVHLHRLVRRGPA